MGVLLLLVLPLTASATMILISKLRELRSCKEGEEGG